uniref:Uncharacterized protein n=1 Tax=Meloidogyne incognita TaxID=6306 RepID=A0A914KZ02_MELIC
MVSVYGCGECPKGVYKIGQLVDYRDDSGNIEQHKTADFNKMQCAHCSHGPACNSFTFLEERLFCLEKAARKWTPEKGVKWCAVGACFVGVNSSEMAIVQGCGKCSDQKNLNKCINCNQRYCNDKSKLKTMRCHHLSPNLHPYLKRVKTCHPVISSCYIARDIFGRGDSFIEILLIERNE